MSLRLRGKRFALQELFQQRRNRRSVIENGTCESGACIDRHGLLEMPQRRGSPARTSGPQGPRHEAMQLAVATRCAMPSLAARFRVGGAFEAFLHEMKR